MQVAPRQQYFLGGIGDAFKGAVKGVAKGIKGLIKSPIGKAALLGGLTFGVPGTQFGGLLGKGSLANIIGQKAMTQAPYAEGTGLKGFFQKFLGGEKTLGTTGKVFAGGTALGLVLEAAGLNTDNPSEMAAATKDIGALKGYLRTGYKELNPKADDNEVEAFVEENTREYKAGGGMMRKNFAMGSEEDIPEIEEMSSEELLDILKSIGADKEQASGIKSIKNKMTSQPDPMDERNSMMENIAMEEFGKPLRLLNEEEIIQIEEMMDEMSKKRSKKNNLMAGMGNTMRLFETPFGFDRAFFEDMLIQYEDSGAKANGVNLYDFAIDFIGEPEAKKLMPKSDRTMVMSGGRIGFSDGLGKFPIKKDGFFVSPDFDKMTPEEKRLYENNAKTYKKIQKSMMKKLPKVSEENKINQKKLNEIRKKQAEEMGLPPTMQLLADGGRIGYARGTDEIVDNASGIMGLPQRTNKAGVKELDLRETGGFIPPVGVKEKADDIPAMLSNNEFVFTADAVRGMGGGNVNKGAQRLYDQMKFLEKGGKV